MAATLTSVANGVEVTESSLGGLQYIGSQSDVSVNGAGDGIVVRTPSGNLYQFTNADMGEATAVEAAQTLVAALNAGAAVEYTELTFTWWQSGTSAPVILQTLVNTTGLTVSGFGRQAAGQIRLALSGTLSATAGKVTVFTTGQNEDGSAARIFNPSTTGTFVYIKVFDAAGTNVDNVGNGTTLYASTVIRIYP